MDNRDRQEELVREALVEKQEEAQARAEEEELAAHDRPQDEPDPRTKSAGHKKKTADKWNQ